MTVFGVSQHSCKSSLCSSPAQDTAVVPTAREYLHVVCFMSSLFEARKHYWLIVNPVSSRTTQVLFCKAALQLGGPQHILVHGVVHPQVQDLAFVPKGVSVGALLPSHRNFLLWLSRCSHWLGSLSQSPVPSCPCTEIPPSSGSGPVGAVSTGTFWALPGPPRTVAALFTTWADFS